MTDAPDPLDPLDDVASAVLDGTATADEVARAGRDPELAARVERLGAARDALRATHAAGLARGVDEARREAAITAALAAYDDETTTVAPPAAAPTPMAAVARRRLGTAVPRPWLVGIAAAVALLALAVPLLGGLGSSDSDSEDSGDEMAAEVLQDDAAGDDGGAARAQGGDSEESLEAGAGPAPNLPDLGPFDDLEVLATEAAIRAAEADGDLPVTTSAPSTAAHEETASPLATGAPACPAVADAAYVAQAELDGRPVLALVAREVGSDGTRRVQVIDAADCSVIGTSDAPLRQP